MDLSPDDAYPYVILVYQAGALQASAALHGESLHHVKPHGALCALLRESDEVGDAFARAMEEAFPGTFLYFPAPVETAAVCVAAERRGISVIGEIYPDLSYREDGDVIVERRKSATDAGEAAAQVLRFLESGEVRTVAGTTLALRAQSICIHGDGPNATQVADKIDPWRARRGGRFARRAARMTNAIRDQAAGDEFLVAELDEQMSLETNIRVMGLTRAIAERDAPGIVASAPTSRTWSATTPSRSSLRCSSQSCRSGGRAPRARRCAPLDALDRAASPLRRPLDARGRRFIPRPPPGPQLDGSRVRGADQRSSGRSGVHRRPSVLAMVRVDYGLRSRSRVVLPDGSALPTDRGSEVPAAADAHARPRGRARRCLRGRLSGPGRRGLPAVRDQRCPGSRRRPVPAGLRRLDDARAPGGHRQLPCHRPRRVRGNSGRGRCRLVPFFDSGGRLRPGRVGGTPTATTIPCSRAASCDRGPAPGAFTTVQDLGRTGMYAIGVPPAGALDGFSARAANLVVGNSERAALLEITYQGPKLLFHGDGVVAATGADTVMTVDGVEQPTWERVPVSGDSVLGFERMSRGARVYLAIAGGVDVEEVLGSRSTYPAIGIGGFRGRPLRKGDRLSVGLHEGEAARSPVALPAALRPQWTEVPDLRVVLGPHDHLIEPNRSTCCSDPIGPQPGSEPSRIPLQGSAAAVPKLRRRSVRAATPRTSSRLLSDRRRPGAGGGGADRASERRRDSRRVRDPCDCDQRGPRSRRPGTRRRQGPVASRGPRGRDAGPP